MVGRGHILLSPDSSEPGTVWIIALAASVQKLCHCTHSWSNSLIWTIGDRIRRMALLGQASEWKVSECLYYHSGDSRYEFRMGEGITGGRETELVSVTRRGQSQEFEFHRIFTVVCLRSQRCVSHQIPVTRDRDPLLSNETGLKVEHSIVFEFSQKPFVDFLSQFALLEEDTWGHNSRTNGPIRLKFWGSVFKNTTMTYAKFEPDRLRIEKMSFSKQLITKMAQHAEIDFLSCDVRATFSASLMQNGLID